MKLMTSPLMITVRSLSPEQPFRMSRYVETKHVELNKASGCAHKTGIHLEIVASEVKTLVPNDKY